ncbi:uncharacterized protein [Centruroides vittatus]|uniref:uncharacterized protein n=1 Tax=Centruroides vittatus TaxID=120091 RepID=UPI00350FA530
MEIEVTESEINNTMKQIFITNFDYLKSSYGICKVLQLILNIICLGLLSHQGTTHRFSYHFHTVGRYKVGKYYTNFYYEDLSEDFFLTMISFSLLFITILIYVSCIISLETSITLPRTTFYFAYHIFGFLLYFIGGLIVLIQESTFNKRSSVIVAAVIAFINSFLYGYNVILAYKSKYGWVNIFSKNPLPS